jgi:hypothetical protein
MGSEVGKESVFLPYVALPQATFADPPRLFAPTQNSLPRSLALDRLRVLVLLLRLEPFSLFDALTRRPRRARARIVRHILRSGDQLVICESCNKGWHQLCSTPHIPHEIVDSTLPWFKAFRSNSPCSRPASALRGTPRT